MNVYSERAHLLALLAGQYPSWIGYTDPSEPECPVVTIHLPTGQCCWHVAPDDVVLFRHVRPVTGDDPAWDGHSTDEKYRRVRMATQFTAWGEGE